MNGPPLLKNTRWWLIGLVIFALSTVVTYYSFSYYLNFTLNSNNNFAVYHIGELLDNPNAILSKPPTQSRDFWLAANLKYDSLSFHREVPFKTFLLLGLQANKSLILINSGDTSGVWDSFDLSLDMQNISYIGGSVYHLSFDNILTPRMETVTGFPYLTPPYSSIIVWSADLNEMVYIFGFAAVFGIILPFLIILFGSRQKKKLIYQNQEFLIEVDRAFAKIDEATIKNIFGAESSVLKSMKKLEDQVSEVKESEDNIKQSLESQIKQITDMAKPLTQGNWEVTVDAPPGILTPFTELLNAISAKAKELSLLVGASDQKKAVHIAGTDIEGSNVFSTEESTQAHMDSWSRITENNDEYLLHLSGQLSLIVNIVPPLFDQLEELYEVELNNNLRNEIGNNDISLQVLESLISEKNTTIYTLDKLQKTVNELLMLRNWVSLKMAKK